MRYVVKGADAAMRNLVYGMIRGAELGNNGVFRVELASTTSDKVAFVTASRGFVTALEVELSNYGLKVEVEP
jgi:hypothetical protein